MVGRRGTRVQVLFWCSADSSSRIASVQHGQARASFTEQGSIAELPVASRAGRVSWFQGEEDEQESVAVGRLGESDEAVGSISRVGGFVEGLGRLGCLPGIRTSKSSSVVGNRVMREDRRSTAVSGGWVWSVSEGRTVAASSVAWFCVDRGRCGAEIEEDDGVNGGVGSMPGCRLGCSGSSEGRSWKCRSPSDDRRGAGESLHEKGNCCSLNVTWRVIWVSPVCTSWQRHSLWIGE